VPFTSASPRAIAGGFALGAHGRGAHPIDRWPCTMEDETVENQNLAAVGSAEYKYEWYLLVVHVFQPELLLTVMTIEPYSSSFLQGAAAAAASDRASAAGRRGEMRRTQQQSCTRMRCVRRLRSTPYHGRGASNCFPASPTVASRFDLDALAWHV